MTPTPLQLLNAIEGIAYLVDAEGVLQAAGGSAWDSFPAENASLLPASAVVGQNLFDLIEGEETRTVYRALHDRALAGARHLTFEYRCDAPDLERRMRMAMGPVIVAGEAVGVLYHSTLMSSLSRVPLAYLTNDEALRRHRASLALPIVTVCAWCADVSDGAGVWFKPEAYYRRGGAADVQLSHAVCPGCIDKVITPMLTGP